MCITKEYMFKGIFLNGHNEKMTKLETLIYVTLCDWTEDTTDVAVQRDAQQGNKWKGAVWTPP